MARNYFAAGGTGSGSVATMRRSLVVLAVVLSTGCGSKMPLPRDLDAHAMELSISGPHTALEAGPFLVRGFRDVPEKEADTVLGVAKARADRTFSFQLSRSGETLREVACRAYRRTTNEAGLTAESAALACVIGTAGGNSYGALQLADASRGSLRLGAETFVVAPDAQGLGTLVRRGDASLAAWQYTTPRTAWIATTADAELQASLVSAMAACIVYREFLKS